MTYKSRYFTLRRAGRALVLIKRIVADILDDAPRMRELQELLEAAERAGRDEQARFVRADLAGVAERYQRCLGELDDLGVELVDVDLGVVEFPCIADGVEVRLCWRFGRGELVGWHEVGQCYAACRPIGSLPDSPILVGG